MECDFAIALPYKFRLQDNMSIVEDLQEQNSRTLGNYSRRLQDYSSISGVPSSLGMLHVFLRTFGL
jgi:hypothetical protein